jgi:hypothetical protein
MVCGFGAGQRQYDVACDGVVQHRDNKMCVARWERIACMLVMVVAAAGVAAAVVAMPCMYKPVAILWLQGVCP